MQQLNQTSRRTFLKGSAARGATSALASGAAVPALASSHLPDPASVLADISVSKYVREDYQKLYNMTGDPLWNPNKDWIRTVDWEKARSELAGTSVRFAVGAADAESAAEGLFPSKCSQGSL